jgi:hypothetical protein
VPEGQTAKNVRIMKARNDELMAETETEDLREHYELDYGKAKPNRFADRFSEESLVVVLDPDVAAVFTTSEAANQALRGLIAALEGLAETPDLLENVKSRSAAGASSQS